MCFIMFCNNEVCRPTDLTRGSRGLQDLLEARVTAAFGAQRHQRCPDECTTHRSDYREWGCSPLGDLNLAIPNSEGSLIPSSCKVEGMSIYPTGPPNQK